MTTPERAEREGEATTVERSDLPPDEARALIKRCRETREESWRLLYEIHLTKAWAVDYNSFEACFLVEFDLSHSAAYAQLAQAGVTIALEGAAGVSLPVVSQRTAEVLAPVIDVLAESVKEQTAGKPRKDRPAIVRDTIEEVAKVPRAGHAEQDKRPESPRSTTMAIPPAPLPEKRPVCSRCHGTGEEPEDAPPAVTTTPIHRITDRLAASKPLPAPGSVSLTGHTPNRLRAKVDPKDCRHPNPVGGVCGRCGFTIPAKPKAVTQRR